MLTPHVWSFPVWTLETIKAELHPQGPESTPEEISSQTLDRTLIKAPADCIDITV